MRKIHKPAFSLAELLIAMGIIAVVATMGVSISKKGVERAYNQYFYTAYDGLYSIIVDSYRDGYPIYRDNPANNDCPSDDFKNNLEMYKVKTGIDANAENPLSYPPTCSQYAFRTKNNITVYIAPMLSKTIDTETVFYAKMFVSVPAANNKRAHFEVAYFPNYMNGILMPTSSGDALQNIYNLQKRPDLIPFYADNGKSGRIVNIYDVDTDKYTPSVFDEEEGSFVPLGEGNYSPFEYTSFIKAYCLNASGISIDGIVNCDSSGNNPSDDKDYVILPANPRKVF